MKALTLRQPWATLIAIGAKRIETRSWRTAYRGPLAIHAAKGFPTEAKILCRSNPFHAALHAGGFASQSYSAELPRGCVIATCTLASCVPVEVVDNAGNVFGVSLQPLSERERAFGDYSPGRFAWILEDMQALAQPVAAKGALSLWEWGGV